MPKKDENVVQPDAVPEETPSPEEVTPPEGGEQPPQVQPLDAEIEAKIKEAVAKATEEATEAARRTIQSAKDKATSEVEAARRGQRLADVRLAGFDKGLGQLDPETAEAIRKDAQLQALLQEKAEETQRQQREVYARALNESLYAHLEALGIDPNDKRVDFAQDEPDYIKGRGKFDASVARILQENAKTADEKRSQEVKDVEARLRKDLGIDSVDTSASEGATISKKFAQVEQDYADGKISTAEYEKAMEKRK